ncbi:hypothetical protein IVG45_13205 [Methylomonas sp. LL1]|uniref:hypothetical protein n=1 Tax=Methylomonas sp. LL1 TaxID=2785785 RepID=UPI0018C43346|nr:hypothetical protein [Methylomonas sp. LL1]QPK61822.1 hypothetical protein IVG45_13205 [Methylomonas sp. LL1]
MDVFRSESITAVGPRTDFKIRPLRQRQKARAFKPPISKPELGNKKKNIVQQAFQVEAGLELGVKLLMDAAMAITLGPWLRRHPNGFTNLSVRCPAKLPPTHSTESTEPIATRIWSKNSPHQ